MWNADYFNKAELCHDKDEGNIIHIQVNVTRPQ